MARRRDESGQVVAAFAAVVTALLMLTALVVDLSPALVARVQQQESLSQAAQSCADAAICVDSSWPKPMAMDFWVSLMWLARR